MPCSDWIVAARTPRTGGVASAAGFFALACAAAACSEQSAPPEVTRAKDAWITVEASAAADGTVAASAGGEARGAPKPGSVEDNLPFSPSGERAASIAWRSWIYTDIGPKRTRYGYLRAGAVVDVRGPPIHNDGCEGGWYRVNPRGFICLGLGATLDLAHPVAVASAARAVRGAGLPYLYALSRDKSPLLYFRLPTREEMNDSEAENVADRAMAFRSRAGQSEALSSLLAVGDVPAFLRDGQKLTKPHGVKQPLRYLYHAGKADPESGFAMSRTFTWQDRVFGLTTELDVIALDRTEIVVPSPFQGVKLEEGEELPVGFVYPYATLRYETREGGQLAPTSELPARAAVKLSGERRSGGMVQARDGSWVTESHLRVLPRRTSFPSFATGDRKWVDVSIKEQSLVAYVGRKPVYATLVSTGRSGMADPEKTDATVRGSFMIYQKEVSATMDGEEDRADSFNLHDVPFVQYFHKGYALHGTYWHDDFGKPRSHGCVNLAPVDAAWLFEWTDPSVPKEWHGVLNKERGTVVYVRP